MSQPNVVASARERHERQVKRAHAVYNAAIGYVEAYEDLLAVVGEGIPLDPTKIELAEAAERQLWSLAAACQLYLRENPAARRAVGKRLERGRPNRKERTGRKESDERDSSGR